MFLFSFFSLTSPSRVLSLLFCCVLLIFLLLIVLGQSSPRLFTNLSEKKEVRSLAALDIIYVVKRTWLEDCDCEK
ncbi:hypothetical protein CMV_007645 [Castanea mollissima]|uniref:Uncharacterized protein n=1 Tax=Castanea mollissima TaxID=60419 RepID=A0A8J4RHQ5_9ROSI|nr:hypothetical protein CMV_007645 [Castanea mollissima]